jgi:N-acetylglucosaminyldiphosphoundecaprenol N-acetyl-beta-D-mannosaminyltransferase
VTRRCAVLLGTPIDDVTLEEAVDVVAGMIATGRATGRTHQIATVNVDFVVNAAADDTLRAVMGATDLSIPDGMGVVWGARAIGAPLRERTAGVDLVPALASRAAAAGWRLCLFGGRPGVAERAADVLRAGAPGADLVVVPAPQVEADGTMDEAVVNELRAVSPDIIGVALGNPKQERWIARYGAAVGAPVCIGIGGTLDFLTGETKRAPAWMQRAGMEWIHRALSEPRRLMGRYAHDLVVFGPSLAGQIWRGRRRRERGAVVLREEPDATTVELSSLARLDNTAIGEIAAALRGARLAGRAARVVGAGPGVLADARRLGVASVLEPTPSPSTPPTPPHD